MDPRNFYKSTMEPTSKSYKDKGKKTTTTMVVALAEYKALDIQCSSYSNHHNY
jgi:hypothetical protein